MAFYFKHTNKGKSITKGDEEHHRKNNICQFCKKHKKSDKNRDHCHLTGKYRCPAYRKCNINVTEKQNTCIPFVFHNFSIYDFHLFYKKSS